MLKNYKKITLVKVLGLGLVMGLMTSCGGEKPAEKMEEVTEEATEAIENATEAVEEVVTEGAEEMMDSTSEAATEEVSSAASGADDFASFFEGDGSGYEGYVFEFGETSTDGKTLSAEAKAMFDKVAEIMIANPNAKIEVRGHTRNVGVEATNKVSSKARALLVQGYLKEKSIDGKRIDTKGKGSSMLLDGAAEDDMSQKRITMVLTQI